MSTPNETRKKHLPDTMPQSIEEALSRRPTLPTPSETRPPEGYETKFAGWTIEQLRAIANGKTGAHVTQAHKATSPLLDELERLRARCEQLRGERDDANRVREILQERNEAFAANETDFQTAIAEHVAANAALRAENESLRGERDELSKKLADAHQTVAHLQLNWLHYQRDVQTERNALRAENERLRDELRAITFTAHGPAAIDIARRALGLDAAIGETPTP